MKNIEKAGKVKDIGEFNPQNCYPKTLTLTPDSFTICEPFRNEITSGLAIYFFVGD
jgi:hypothetical protein